MREELARALSTHRRGNPSMDPPLTRDYEGADKVLDVVRVVARNAELIYGRMHSQCWCASVGKGNYTCDDCSRIDDALDDLVEVLNASPEA